MIYIDFDGVILDTEDVMFEEWHKKPNIHLLTEEDKIRYLQELDWDYLISISEPINNSIELLNRMDPSKTAILTKIHSLKEGAAKIRWAKKNNIKQSIILVPHTLKKSDVVDANNNLLIDDYLKNLDEWISCGGNAILFDKNSTGYDTWGQFNYKGYRSIKDLEEFTEKIKIKS